MKTTIEEIMEAMREGGRAKAQHFEFCRAVEDLLESIQVEEDHYDSEAHSYPTMGNVDATTLVTLGLVAAPEPKPKRADVGVTLHLLGVNREDFLSGTLEDQIQAAIDAAKIAKQAMVEDVDLMDN